MYRSFENFTMLSTFLPNAEKMVNIPAVGVLGLMVGFLAGLLGVGGGFLTVPFLNIIFGIPYNFAIGSSLCQMVGTSLSATIGHYRIGNVNWKLGLLLLIGSIFGAESGARLLQAIKGSGEIVIRGHQVLKMDLWMNSLFIILLILIGTLVFLERRKGIRRTSSGREKFPILLLIGGGFLAGLFSGLMGIGGGFLIVPFLIYGLGRETTLAIGTSCFLIIFTSAYGGISHWLKENVDLILVAPLLIGSIIGAQLGTVTTKKVGGASLRYYFAWVCYLGAAIVLLSLLRKIGIV